MANVSGGVRRLMTAAKLSGVQYCTRSCRLPGDETLTDESVISSVSSILREHRSRSRWNYIKAQYPSGFSSSQVSAIILRLKNNPHLGLRFFLWSEEKSLCNHDLHSYSTIIHVLTRSRLRSCARALIQKAICATENEDHEVSSNLPNIFKALEKSYRACDSAPFVFDLLIEACLQARKIDRSVEIVRALRDRCISPMAATSNWLINSIYQMKGFEAGFAMYREIFENDEAKVPPNVHTFNMLLLWSYRESEVEIFERIRGKMEVIGCRLNAFTYSVLIAAECAGRKLDEALKLWEEMQNNQIEPDAMAYNALISGFCENGELSSAEHFLHDMTLRDIQPTCVTYEELIQGYINSGRIDSALHFFKEMCGKHLRTGVSVIEKLVGKLCENRRAHEALELLQGITGESVIFPSRMTYLLLISGLCNEGNMLEAADVQAKMAGQGFQPDNETYSAFIRGYLKQGDEDTARKLHYEMVYQVSISS